MTTSDRVSLLRSTIPVKQALHRVLTPSFLPFRLGLRCSALGFRQFKRLTYTHLGLLGQSARKRIRL